jgi:hypothetical protein
MKKLIVRCAVVAASILFAHSAGAGTQDFLLVNDTGVEIFYLYVSETNNESWEEDVLGEDVLPYGAASSSSSRGVRRACGT